MPAIRPDFTRLNVGDFIAGGASFVTMIGIFLPWFGYPVNPEFGGATFDLSATGLRSWMYLAFFVALAVVAYQGARVVIPFKPPVDHWIIVTVACGIDLLLVVVCFATKPAGLSWEFGAYFSLLVAAGAVVGAVVSRAEGLTRATTFAAGPARAAAAGPGVPIAPPPGAPPFFPVPSAPPAPATPARPASPPSPTPDPRSPGQPPAEQIAEVVTCRACARANPATHRFCDGCGGPIGG